MTSQTEVASISDFEIALIRSRLVYDPLTGIIRQISRDKKKRRPAVLGAVGCARDQTGYIRLYVNRKRYYAHRIAWLLTHGRWPNGVIDHINGDPSDNRLTNLRECSQVDNCKNTRRPSPPRSGVRGVFLEKNGRYIAYVCVDGKKIHVGSFGSLEEAATARKQAALNLYGQFAGDLR